MENEAFAPRSVNLVSASQQRMLVKQANFGAGLSLFRPWGQVLETDSAEPITYYKHDYSRGSQTLEELQRLLAERGLIALVHDKPGELLGRPSRVISSQAQSKIACRGKVQRLERKLVEPSGSKRQAPEKGDDIVCSA